MKLHSQRKDLKGNDMTRHTLRSIALVAATCFAASLGGCDQESSTPASRDVDPAARMDHAVGKWSSAAGGGPLQLVVTDTAGNTLKLEDYKGKYVVLEWLNHECPFVRKHYDSGNMQQLQKTYTDKGVVWLSIISSAPGKQGHYAPEKIDELTKKEKASPTAVIVDSSGDLGRAFGAKTTPHMFVLNPDGRAIFNGPIDDRDSTDVADVEGATNYVAAALEGALAGKPIDKALRRPYGCSVKY